MRIRSGAPREDQHGQQAPPRSKRRKTHTLSPERACVFPAPPERVSLGDFPPPEPSAGQCRPWRAPTFCLVQG